ncbi:hypothetical protein [Mycolicibacterium confluentis]|uniref:Uncharacterized protein n=1 Tax=Mycolicibacterium confluentis TaxID=28047 RepID=A0A7I7XR77_9MYCO|nr:hypothetical protein [Mycolicibacterium confluentis]MCV7322521.1 hypothetical protein [Mycolicibacterium confluentis]ORV21374.1 hypothetical protein AWB99_26360 [Mycolicibacterium confluentis]BBZ31738.1 hypothetical protein MCNF_03430 [Mycolicibacterium confluentis]
MARKTIEQFMWAYQHIFRRSVNWALSQSLNLIGVDAAEPEVFLIGTLVDGGTRHPLCIEPEDGPIVPADFGQLDERALTLYRESPDSRMAFGDSRHHALKHREFLDRAYGAAIKEVLDVKLALDFTVSLPTRVEEHRVFTAVGLPHWVFDGAPQLTHEAEDNYRPITRSLVHGVVAEALRQCSLSLYLPDPSAIHAAPLDISKAAAKALTESAARLAGTVTGGQLFEGLNRLATTPYERRVGVGSLLLTAQTVQHVDCSLRFRKPVHVNETRALRKLLETSSRNGESLLTDGEVAFGLGRRKANYPESSQSVFQLVVAGNGAWELLHGEARLTAVEFGEPRLPVQQLRPERLNDMCSRLFEAPDSHALWGLARAASEAEHGTMLVISDSAADEATRLGSQAFLVEPTQLSAAGIRQVTAIDGGVLVDPSGTCYAIGVILDGMATTRGDRSRGSRYNSAVRYLASAKARGAHTVILLVSEDGMINLLPEMPPRISRSERDALVLDLREAAALEPVNAERFYNAYRRVEAKAFYLSQEQVDEVNWLMTDHWKRRMAAGGGIRLHENPLRVDPEMNEEYLLE